MHPENIAISVENVRKCYHIYERPKHRLLQMVFHGRRKFYQEFWALKDVSIDIKPGETIGIIGCNGSGKSTLLQIICGTLNPTGGIIRSKGRIAALLELGAGFNPEFTGRENIYMSASIHGLTKDLIDERFDTIAAFADIGNFIDQPVKTYSSGMYVRLAFAVIANVDADILVIDEALAVGDALFTQKCMRFIRKFKENGTLLFVSHDMSSVLSLCDRALWLHDGQVRAVGESREIAKDYLQYTMQELYGEAARLNPIEAPSTESMASSLTAEQHEPAIDYASQVQVHDNLNEANGWKTGAGEILTVHLGHLATEDSTVFKGGEVLRMTITAVTYQDMEKPIIGFLVRDRLGQDLFGENTLPYTDQNPQPIKAGSRIESEFVFRLPMLPNGHYAVMASLAEGDLQRNVQHHWLHDALILTVSSSKVRWGLVGVQFMKVALKEIQ